MRIESIRCGKAGGDRLDLHGPAELQPRRQISNSCRAGDPCLCYAHGRDCNYLQRARGRPRFDPHFVLAQTERGDVTYLHDYESTVPRIASRSPTTATCISAFGTCRNRSGCAAYQYVMPAVQMRDGFAAATAAARREDQRPLWVPIDDAGNDGVQLPLFLRSGRSVDARRRGRI